MEKEMNAEEVLKNFLGCWQKKKWRSMGKNFCQKSWFGKGREGLLSCYDALKNWFGHKKLLKFEILELEEKNDVWIIALVRIEYELLRKKHVRYIRPTLVKERGSYNVSKEGEWGVNPKGALREYEEAPSV